MEADWEVEVGGDAPVIDADWSGLVDLRNHPARIHEIQEAHDFPALGDVLVRLNGSHSPIRTAKCDLWTVDGLDRYELDASEGDARVGLACYIDMVADAETVLANLDAMTRFGRVVSDHLRTVPLRCCRIDMVIRGAVFFSGREGFGVTAYATGCGVGREAAESRLGAALSALVDALCPSENCP